MLFLLKPPETGDSSPSEAKKSDEIKEGPETPEELLIAILELDKKHDTVRDAVEDTSMDIDAVLAGFKDKARYLHDQNQDNPEILDLLQTIEEGIQDLEKDLEEINGEFEIKNIRSAKRMSAMPELFEKFGLIFENKQVQYDEIDQFFRSTSGKSFFECWEVYGLPGANNEEEFIANFDQYVSLFMIGNYSKEIALATAFAEEANFGQERDGSLLIRAYSGMNMPHSVVLTMFNEVFQGVQFDADGNPHGIGRLKIDTGSDSNDVEITIDFDNKIISPPLKTKDQLGNEQEINFDHFMTFANYYISKDPRGESLFIRQGDSFSINHERTNENAMIIFMNTPNPHTMLHETMHAFYDNNPEYRKTVLDKVRQSTAEQRECAVLFTACSYDPLDPDADNVTKDLVIDEAYNAYSSQGRYVVAEMSAPDWTLNIWRFCERYNISLSLNDYNSLSELGIEHLSLMETKDREDLDSNESEFIQKNPEKVLKGCSNFKLLRELLIKQHPDLYKKIQIAREKLVDWVDAV